MDMEFDRNNFCWLSFPNGVQVFDGHSFSTVPVQEGLPDDKHVYFFRNNEGELLLSHLRGISKYELSSNKFKIVFHTANAKWPAQFIGQDEGTIYFYTDSGHIKGVDAKSFRLLSDARTGIPATTDNIDFRPKISDNIVDHRVAFNVMSTLYLWDLKNRRMISRSDPVFSMSGYTLTLKSPDEVIYFTYNDNSGLHSYNFTRKVQSALPVKGKDDQRIGRSIILPWQGKTFISFNNRLYETDPELRELKSELVNFQNDPVAGSSSIASIKEDNFGNLCLATITGGIVKIIRNNYDIKYYSSGEKNRNFILSVLPDKGNNRILAGTASSGLMVFDTLQKLVKHIKTAPGLQVFSPNLILKAKNGDYIIFPSGEDQIFRLSGDLTSMKAIPIASNLPPDKSGIDYFANIIYQDGKKAIVQTQGRLFRVDMEANTVFEVMFTSFYTMSGILYDDHIITHANDELIFLDTADFKRIKTVPFNNTGNVRCFTKDAAGNIYMGSNKGIFKIDGAGNILLHLNKKTGLPDECIYSIAIDQQGLLWCSSNKGIFRINKDGSIFQITKDDGLQENEFNTNVVAEEGEELFFGGVNGLSSFYPSGIDEAEEQINLLFTRIRINNEDSFKDTAIWALSDITLPHDRNSLSFDFIAMGNNNPGQYIYQYMMDGIDEEWLPNNGMQTVRYFLPPGTYYFKVYASRYFNKDAKPIKEIRIVIRPPFWKTWWFLTILGILLIALMAYSFDQYNRAKYRKKLADLESEHKIQLERERISRDLHDNIGAYAHAVLYNTELLEKEDENTMRVQLMKDLKFASKDIITSLRETIWALQKDNYSASDCLLRIRNFVQPFTRYYHHIQFRIDGDAPDLNLHYTKALNLVRIVQEAVTNAIKHAGANNIIIQSRQVDDKWELTVTDDGRWVVRSNRGQEEEGNGLNNMKTRAADSGFDFQIQPGANGGTEVRIFV
jgi:signal transduction histidine kinase